MEGEHRARFKLATFHAVSRLIRCHRSFSFSPNFSLIFDFVLVVIIIIIIIVVVSTSYDVDFEKRKKWKEAKRNRLSWK